MSQQLEGRTVAHRWGRAIWPFFRPMRTAIALTAAMAVVSGGVAALGPLVQQRVLDYSIFGHSQPLLPQLGLLLGLAVLAFVSKKVLTYRESKVIMEVQYVVRNAAYRALQQQDVSSRRSLSSGQLVSRLNTDISILVRSLSSLPRLSGSMVFMIEAAVVMFTLNTLLALLILAMIPVLVFIVLRMRSAVRPATWDAQQAKAELVQSADQAISGVHVVKAFGAERHELNRMVRFCAHVYSSTMRLIRLQGRFQPILSAVPASAQVGVFALGGLLVLEHHLTAGTFLAFSSYVVQLVSPAKELADTVLSMQEAGVSAGRVLELLDADPAVEDDPDAPELPRDTKGALHFDRIDFGYEPGNGLLRGFDLRIEPGEKVALLGASGSGKSTVALLAARLHDVDAGQVRLDGVDISTVRLASVRSRIGVLFENPFLFSGTIRENILFSKPEASEAELLAAARAAQVDGFVSELPDGYDTVIGERGAALSGGQRQRIALARILLIDPAVLVLDSPTSAVDVTTEHQLTEALRAIIAPRTVLLIAHRQSTVNLADWVAVLDEGRVCDIGTQEELRARCPRFRELIGEFDEDEQQVDEDTAARETGTTASAWPEVQRPVQPWDGDPAELADVDLTAETRDVGGFRLREFLRPYRRTFAFALVLVLLDAIASVAQTYLSRIGVDDGILAGSSGVLYAAAAVFAGTVLIDLYLSRLIILRIGVLGQRLVFALRMRIWAHLQRLSIDYFERSTVGQLLTRVVNDVDSFSMLLSSGLVLGLVYGFSLVGIIVVMLVLSVPLAGITLLVLLPTAVLTFVYQRRVSSPYRRSRQSIAMLNGLLREGFTGIREAQAFGQEESQFVKFDRANATYRDARIATQRSASVYFATIDLLGRLLALAVLGFGAGLVADRSLTIGGLVVFLLCVDAFFGPIRELGYLFDDWQQVKVSVERVDDLARERPMARSDLGPQGPERITGALELREVRFRYPTSERDVLTDTNLVLPAGRSLALIGRSGAGKSTVVKLLAGFYQVTAGAIFVDEVDLREVDPAQYQRSLGYVPQEPFLFSGSVRDNIAYSRPDATDAEVEAAARVVGAHRIIRGLRDGYRHELGSAGGSDLSAGQRQLICLARAQLADPAIVLLDEATSNVDSATEARVFRAMRAVSGARVTVMIAHRLNTARQADWIGVVEDGRIVELGTHQELTEARGRYFEFCSAALAAVE